jgi:ubiquinone/menaquinone biosynthesis C-methylase UbiE
MQRIIFDPIQRAVLQLAEEEIGHPGTILDVGCGTGKLLRSASERFPGARLVGVDAAIEMVKQAQSSTPNGTIQFQQATAEELPFPDGSFDLVFSTMTFHHWSDQQKAIGEIKRVLAPRGRWLLADIVAKGPMAVVARLLRIGRVVSPSHLDRMLAAEGLVVISRQKVPGAAGNIPVLTIGAV